MVHLTSFGFGIDDPVELFGLGLTCVHLILNFEPKLVQQAITSGRKVEYRRPQLAAPTAPSDPATRTRTREGRASEKSADADFACSTHIVCHHPPPKPLYRYSGGGW